MCYCGKPTINGEPGAYSWDGKNYSTYTPHPPALGERDTLIFDEPGRCGGMDCHSHHFRLVKEGTVYLALLVQHGAGQERIRLGHAASFIVDALAALDTNTRYWSLHTLYSTHRAAEEGAKGRANATWREAAAEKRIKTRKVRAGVKVWVEPRPPVIDSRHNLDGVEAR